MGRLTRPSWNWRLDIAGRFRPARSLSLLGLCAAPEEKWKRAGRRRLRPIDLRAFLSRLTNYSAFRADRYAGENGLILWK